MIPEIQEFLRQKRYPFLPEKFSISLIGNGAYNTTYLIKGNNGCFVFRVNSHIGALPGYGLDSEHNILSLLPHGIAPTPFVVDTTKTEFPFPFRIESFERGKNPQITDELLKLIAQHLAQVHAITFPKCGAFPGLFETYSHGTTIKPFMEQTQDQSAELRAICDAARRWIAYHDKRSPLRDFSLVHYDLHTENMLYDGSKLTFIDWEYAEIGDPAVDLATVIWYSTLFSFCPVFTEQQREVLLREYERIASAKIRERLRIQEPLVVLLETLWMVGQLKHREHIPEHIRTSERVEMYEQGIEIGLAYLGEHGFAIKHK